MEVESHLDHAVALPVELRDLLADQLMLVERLLLLHELIPIGPLEADAADDRILIDVPLQEKEHQLSRVARAEHTWLYITHLNTMNTRTGANLLSRPMPVDRLVVAFWALDSRWS